MMQRMKTYIRPLLLCLAWTWSALAQDNSTTVFQIGQPDGDYAELAIAGNYAAYPQRFPHDVEFVAGQSDARQQWPFIHPGPIDDWAGSRPHAFKISFTLPEPRSGYYRLVLDFVSTHNSNPPRMTIAINDAQINRRLPAGNGDEALTHAKAGRRCSVEQLIPAKLFHAGTNSITLINNEGSWALYDDVRAGTQRAGPDRAAAADGAGPAVVQTHPVRPATGGAPGGRKPG